MKAKTKGFMLLILCGIILLLASLGTTVQERDVTPVFILLPIAVHLLRCEKKAKKKAAPGQQTRKATSINPQREQIQYNTTYSTLQGLRRVFNG